MSSSHRIFTSVFSTESTASDRPGYLTSPFSGSFTLTLWLYIRPHMIRIHSAILDGIQAVPITVEVSGQRGIPQLIISGLPSKATAEARERLKAALQHCGVRVRAKKIVINLAPADLPKQGTHLDLAMAVGLLRVYEELPNSFANIYFFGELGLDGELRSRKSVLPFLHVAIKSGATEVVVPATSIQELLHSGSLFSELKIHPVQSLQQLLMAKYISKLPLLKIKPMTLPTPSVPDSQPLLLTPFTRRVLTIALAGKHHLLMTGPPGVGKTLTAQTAQHLLPPLNQIQWQELQLTYSMANVTASGSPLQPPFRAPHHRTTATHLLGGGTPLRFGEISFAHHGILFLDEMSEFSSTALDCLRQPLEAGVMHLTRKGQLTPLPAKFLLIGATNPCPCGYLGSRQKACSCSTYIARQYQQKISEPLRDRFDLRIWLSEINEEILQNKKTLITYGEVRQEILRARKKQTERYAGTKLNTNSDVSPEFISKYCSVTHESEVLLKNAVKKFNLTGRGYHRVLKVARTIADLDTCKNIEKTHIAEALQYRG